jgi:hypothetical protein
VRISVKQAIAALIGAAITVGLSWLGVAWYHRAVVQTPLARAVAHIKGVRRVNLSGAGGLTIWIEPTANIADVYPVVEAAARQAAGSAVPIQVGDHPTAGETALMNRLQFILATGQATGQYVTMERRVAAAARAAHENVSLALSATRLFVTIGTSRAGAPDRRLIEVLVLPKGGNQSA